MPATTRQQTANIAELVPEDSGPSDIEQHMRIALHGVGKLRNQIEVLSRENSLLKEDLDRMYNAQDVSIQPRRGRKGNVSVLSLTAQVNKLKRQVAELEDARRKDKKRIRKLQMKEARRDALELNNEVEHDVHDETADMRKLLRQFVELMSSPSMEEKEECAVCLTEMTLETAQSLPCGHIFCSVCLPKLDPQNCPNCREPFASLEDVEPVKFTATEQWDALLEVATEWGRIDKGESPDDTDEVDMPFIEDAQESSVVSEELPGGDDAEISPDSHDADHPTNTRYTPRIAASTPTPTPDPDDDNHRSFQQDVPATPLTPIRVPSSPISYQSSPLTLKRQRMRELAEERMAKRTRR